ncbi:hypothetical protein [Microbacterium indicum]|uniref:hypothetical protein n=1 Tax=Microbacterium indicum TaxID=358100 RepID=UPI00048C862B|nr:hypothetical protein [Microbacterium indicum]
MFARRPSKAVLRRRRLVVGCLGLIVFAAIVVGIVLGVQWLVRAQPWNDLPFVGSSAAEATATPDPVPTLFPTDAADASPNPSADPSATPEACANGSLEVSAVLDGSTYAADQDPQLSMQLTNVGGADCVVNVGTTQQAFEITSGSDTWWRSTDCQTEPADQWVTIAAGQSVSSSEPLTWDRTRSSTDTCDSDSRPAATGGGATYALTVSLGDVTSEPVSFILE